jgi:hypothetical protein
VFTASSAMNFPITSACLWLVVIWVGVGSTRRTYWGGLGAATANFHNKFGVHYFLSSAGQRLG